MIEAIIHVHNRTQHLKRAVETAVSSAVAVNAVVRVSSNASDEFAQAAAYAVARQYGVPFTQSQTKTAFHHFAASVVAAKHEYICLLHDDDFVELNYFKSIQDLIDNYPEGAAYAPDANFMIDSCLHQAGIAPRRCFRLSPTWLALLYLLGRCGPPFPCIVYRLDFARVAFLRDPAFAKYSDTVIVLEASHAGLWVFPKSTFTYVLGDHNDSRIVDKPARRRLRWWLLRQVITTTSVIPVQPLANLQYFLGRFVKRRLRV